MKKIRIGNQTAFSALTPLMPFEYAVANGFNAFEWFPDRHASGQGWDESDIDEETRSYIRDTARAHDIALSVHASLKSNPLHAETHGLILKDIEFAHDIGAGLVNIHLDTGSGIENYVEAVTPIIRHTRKAGVRLSIENTVLSSPEEFNRIFGLFHKLKIAARRDVGMCFDLGHANLYQESHNDYMQFLDLLEPGVPIIHIHLHENYGDSDSHLPLFTGPSGADMSGICLFIKRMKKRGFAGSIILEQWPEPPLLLNEARDRLNYMWNEKC
jgi:sugar phosphate isomerase/epimerase